MFIDFFWIIGYLIFSVSAASSTFLASESLEFTYFSAFNISNTNSYSIILNDKKSMELIVDYNDMDVGLEILNVEKYVNAKE